MSDWLRIDGLFMEMIRHRQEIGWERAEEILHRVRGEVEAYTGRPMRFRRERNSKVRVGKLEARLKRELWQIIHVRGFAIAKPLFTELHEKWSGWIREALSAGLCEK